MNLLFCNSTWEIPGGNPKAEEASQVGGSPQRTGRLPGIAHLSQKPGQAQAPDSKSEEAWEQCLSSKEAPALGKG